MAYPWSANIGQIKYRSAIPRPFEMILGVNDMLAYFEIYIYIVCYFVNNIEKVMSKWGTVGYDHLFKENEGSETSI